jgi:hypothetical protein
MLMLAPVDPSPVSASTGADRPSGAFWYRLVTAPGEASKHLEWFVRAQHLQPGRAFRVELSVDDAASYSVGSAHADPSGAITTHGVLSRFSDQFCVGQRAVPRPIAGAHSIGVSIKSDGSNISASLGPSVTDPTRSLPCNGNGDGIFEYWLTARTPFQLGEPATDAAR